jgi:hypothetical protein
VSEEIDLKELEKKAYISYHGDGLMDFFWGLGIVGFVETVFFDMTTFAGIVPALAIILYSFTKKKVTVPRIGYVRFGQNRSRPLLLFQGMLIASLLLGLLFGALVFIAIQRGEMPGWMPLILEKYPHLIVGCGGTLLFSLCAYATGIQRFYLYAALTFLLFFGAWMLGIEAKRVAIAVGIVMMGFGMATFRRFLETHPQKVGA